MKRMSLVSDSVTLHDLDAKKVCITVQCNKILQSWILYFLSYYTPPL